MKKKLIEAIKAKFVGIDDATAERLAKRAIDKNEAITNDDEVAAAVEAITLPDVLKSVNDFSADDAIRKYEEKYQLEKGEKKNKPADPAKPADPKAGATKPADPKAAEPQSTEDKALEAVKNLFAEFTKSMEQKNANIMAELTAIKSGKISESRKAKLEAVIKDLKETQRKPYGRIDLSKFTDEEFDSFMSEVKEEVGDILAENRASGASVSPLFGGGHHETNGSKTKEASKEEIDALVGKFGLQESK